MNTLDCMDLIQAIKTVQLYAKEFDRQANKALSSCSVDIEGREIRGAFPVDTLLSLERLLYLMAQYQPITSEKLFSAVYQLQEELCKEQQNESL